MRLFLATTLVIHLVFTNTCGMLDKNRTVKLITTDDQELHCSESVLRLSSTLAHQLDAKGTNLKNDALTIASGRSTQECIILMKLLQYVQEKKTDELSQVLTKQSITQNCTILELANFFDAQTLLTQTIRALSAQLRDPLFLKKFTQESATLLQDINDLPAEMLACIIADLKKSAAYSWLKHKIIEDGTKIQLEGHRGFINSISFSSDNKLLATGSDDCTAKIHDRSSGECIATLCGHQCTITSVSFSSNNKLLVTGSGDYTAKIWDVGTGRCLITLTGDNNSVTSVSFSPDNTLLAINNRTIMIWDVQSGKHLVTLDPDYTLEKLISFSADSKLLASTCWCSQVKIWNIATGYCLTTLTGDNDSSSITSLSFSPDNSFLAVGYKNETVKIWNVKSSSCCETIKVPIIDDYYKHYIPLVSFSSNEPGLKTYNVREISDKVLRQHLARLDGVHFLDIIWHTDRITFVSFSPDNKLLALGYLLKYGNSYDRKQELWQLEPQALNNLNLEQLLLILCWHHFGAFKLSPKSHLYTVYCSCDPAIRKVLEPYVKIENNSLFSQISAIHWLGIGALASMGFMLAVRAFK